MFWSYSVWNEINIIHVPLLPHSHLTHLNVLKDKTIRLEKLRICLQKEFNQSYECLKNPTELRFFKAGNGPSRNCLCFCSINKGFWLISDSTSHCDHSRICGQCEAECFAVCHPSFHLWAFNSLCVMWNGCLIHNAYSSAVRDDEQWSVRCISTGIHLERQLWFSITTDWVLSCSSRMSGWKEEMTEKQITQMHKNSQTDNWNHNDRCRSCL